VALKRIVNFVLVFCFVMSCDCQLIIKENDDDDDDDDRFRARGMEQTDRETD